MTAYCSPTVTIELSRITETARIMLDRVTEPATERQDHHGWMHVLWADGYSRSVAVTVAYQAPQVVRVTVQAPSWVFDVAGSNLNERVEKLLGGLPGQPLNHWGYDVEGADHGEAFVSQLRTLNMDPSWDPTGRGVPLRQDDDPTSYDERLPVTVTLPRRTFSARTDMPRLSREAVALRERLECIEREMAELRSVPSVEVV
jgi:hypothetical protein